VAKDADRPVFRNVVRASAEGSQERRDTSRCERGNAPDRDADPNTNGEGDEHEIGTITGQVLHYRVHPETLLM
jgi:hypothetical protein